MEIEGTTFGTITIDGKTYEHDVIIRLSGEVVKRKKSSSFLARARWATCSPEAEAYFAKNGCRSCCSPPARRSACSTGRMRRRSGFFT
jgi:hypothetical protein